MVSDNLLYNTEVSNDLVKHEVSSRFTFCFEGGNLLFPLGEVINSDNNIFVTPNQYWIACHIFHPPLGEETHRNDKKQWSRMQQHFLV